MKIYYIAIILVFIFSILASKTSNNTSEIVEKNYNSFFVFLIGLVLILIAGLRWKVGTDYLQYSRNYIMYSSIFWDSLRLTGEPGIKLISKVSSFIYDDYATMFLISSIVTIGLAVRTISKHSRALTFSILLYIFIGTWHGSFNGVRQYIAVSIIFSGHQYILEKNLKKYTLIVMLASFFHISALFAILFYFIPDEVFKFKHIIIFLIISITIMNSYSLIFDLVGFFKGKELTMIGYITREVNPLRVVVDFAPLLIYYFLTSKSKLESKENFYINLLFLNAFISLITSNSAHLARFKIYTNIFSVLGIPTLINFDNKYIRFLVKYMMLVLYALFWHFDVLKDPTLVNFQWIFNRP